MPISFFSKNIYHLQQQQYILHWTNIIIWMNDDRMIFSSMAYLHFKNRQFFDIFFGQTPSHARFKWFKLLTWRYEPNEQTNNKKNPFLLRLSTTLIYYPYYTDGISSRSIYYSESFNYAIKIHVKNWTNNEMTNFGYMWYTCTHTCIWNWLIDKDMYKYSHKRTRRACIAQFKFFNCTK